MNCEHTECSNQVEEGKTECYRHRLLSVGFNWKAAKKGRTSWHQSKTEWMHENFGTHDDRELGRQGIERYTG